MPGWSKKGPRGPIADMNGARGRLGQKGPKSPIADLNGARGLGVPLQNWTVPGGCSPDSPEQGGRRSPRQRRPRTAAVLRRGAREDIKYIRRRRRAGGRIAKGGANELDFVIVGGR